ncbi:MAG: NAD(P)-dependent alcohol dehydrogenase [Sumerlaeia bacterium]
MVKAYAVLEHGKPLEEYEFEFPELGPHQVEIEVESCGICHSDLSMIKNEWGMTNYPIVPGHEVAGRVTKVGSHVTMVKPGQAVGLGWFSESCMTCPQCMDGDHNLCPKVEQTIVGRHGGFADKVRAHEAWCIPLASGADMKAVGPLFCGGITVFNPIVQNNVSPMSRVGVVGIGGLGHMALQFLNAWGCHVTAFSSTPDKAAEARELGAHEVLNSRDSEELKQAANSFDMILVTVNVVLDWELYITLLRPRGVLHFVGAVPEIKVGAFPLILGQKSIKGSPLGSPETTRKMMEFAGRHDVKPMIEVFNMSDVNKAIDRLENGKPRYRVVLVR